MTKDDHELAPCHRRSVIRVEGWFLVRASAGAYQQSSRQDVTTFRHAPRKTDLSLSKTRPSPSSLESSSGAYWSGIPFLSGTSYLSAMHLSIEHVTQYHYAMPVELGPHRLMVRPMEGHDVQIRGSELVIQPAHRIRWLHDVFDNSIAMVEFIEPAAQLRVESRVIVEQYNTNPFDFVLDPEACELPFRYPDDILQDVAPYLLREHPQDEEAIRHWIRPFLDLRGRAKTLEFLTALNRSVPLFYGYVQREEPGVQTPGETFKRRTGSCRDFAVLFMEAARYLGLAARFVSGYLCQTSPGQYGPISGATHAWAEIYLPGAGWKGFDPTCGVLTVDTHVRVAVVRTASQAVPVAGSFNGPTSAFQGMHVSVIAQSCPETSTSNAGGR